MEDDPGLEFDFYLAQKLGMTVAHMREVMGHDEFVYWSTYYARIAQRRELEHLASKGGGT